MPNKEKRFDGSDYDHERDSERLTMQLTKIYNLMADGVFRTLGQIEKATGEPQASISAQLRNLRKSRMGGHCVNKKYLGNGLWEYQLIVKND